MLTGHLHINNDTPVNKNKTMINIIKQYQRMLSFIECSFTVLKHKNTATVVYRFLNLINPLRR